MEHKEKIAIVDYLRLYVAQKGSQNKASNSLKGVSPAVISHLLGGNWEPYSDEMFRKISVQIGFNSTEWQFADTSTSMELMELLEASKKNATVITLIGKAGTGKSETTKKFEQQNSNVFRIECGQHWTPEYFLSKIIKKMGINSNSTKVPYMMDEIIDAISNLEKPQIIIDEVDKLKEEPLSFLITFYNELFRRCSIVILATSYLKKRFEDGLRLRKKSYKELHSRYGTYIDLEELSAEDIRLVCELNGLRDENKIKIIAKNSNGDLRPVVKSIEGDRIDNERKIIAS